METSGLARINSWASRHPVAVKTTKALVSASALFVAPKLLGIDPDKFDTGLLPSLLMGAAIGFGKLTNRVLAAAGLIGLILSGPLLALGVVLPSLSLLAARGQNNAARQPKQISQLV